MTEIRYLNSAKKDLREIFLYINTDNPPAAKNLMHEFDKSISLLALFPESGKMPNDAILKRIGYRMLVISNFIVFYSYNGTFIEIKRILNGKRNYSFLLD